MTKLIKKYKPNTFSERKEALSKQPSREDLIKIHCQNQDCEGCPSEQECSEADSDVCPEEYFGDGDDYEE